MRGWAFAALLLLAACMVEEGDDGLTPAEERQCLADGGRVAVAGLSGVTFCSMPTPDAGRACSASSECAGFCEAETRTCSAEASVFGCYAFLDDLGEEVTICVD